jgi:hypothetical protein
LPRSLWHVTQYCFTVAVWAAASKAGAVARRGAGVAAIAVVRTGAAGEAGAAAGGGGVCALGAVGPPVSRACTAANHASVAAIIAAGSATGTNLRMRELLAAAADGGTRAASFMAVFYTPGRARGRDIA